MAWYDGCYGCIVVLVTVFVYISVAGFIQSFGIFTEDFSKEFCTDSPCIGILGLVNALSLSNYRILCGFSVLLESKLTGIGTFSLGAVLCIASLISSCYVTNIHMLLLTYSVLFGFGSTFMLNSPLTVIESYFPVGHRFHMLTTGIVNLGPPIGVAIFNPLVGYVGQNGGTWRHDFHVISVIVALAAFLYIMTILYPILQRQIGKDGYEDIDEVLDEDINDKGNIRDYIRSWCIGYGPMLWLTAIFGVGFAIYIPRVIFIKYLVDEGYSEYDAAIYMMYSGIWEAVFTVIISITADFIKQHIFWVYFLSSILLAAVDALLPHLTTPTGVIVYICVQGATDGLMLSVLYGVMSHVVHTPGEKRLLWSVTNFVVGVGQVVGLPVSGVIYQSNAWAVFYMAGAVFGAVALLFLCLIAVLSRNSDAKDASLDSKTESSNRGISAIADETKTNQ